MTLDQFATLCRNRPELQGQWEALSSRAHELISNRVQEAFHKKRPGSDKFFISAKDEMEKACLKADVEHPDLSFRSFKNWILKY